MRWCLSRLPQPPGCSGTKEAASDLLAAAQSAPLAGTLSATLRSEHRKQESNRSTHSYGLWSSHQMIMKMRWPKCHKRAERLLSHTRFLNHAGARINNLASESTEMHCQGRKAFGRFGSWKAWAFYDRLFCIAQKEPHVILQRNINTHP